MFFIIAKKKSPLEIFLASLIRACNVQRKNHTKNLKQGQKLFLTYLIIILKKSTIFYSSRIKQKVFQVRLLLFSRIFNVTKRIKCAKFASKVANIFCKSKYFKIFQEPMIKNFHSFEISLHFIKHKQTITIFKLTVTTISFLISQKVLYSLTPKINMATTISMCNVQYIFNCGIRFKKSIFLSFYLPERHS